MEPCIQGISSGWLIGLAKSLGPSVDPSIQASPLVPFKEITLRSGNGIDIVRRKFSANRPCRPRAISRGYSGVAGAGLADPDGGVRNHRYRGARESTASGSRRHSIWHCRDPAGWPAGGTRRIMADRVGPRPGRSVESAEVGEQRRNSRLCPAACFCRRYISGPGWSRILPKPDGSRGRLLAHGAGWRIGY